MTVTKSVASVGSIEELIDLTERLTEVMAQETEILNGMRPSEIGSLQSEKASLSIAYSDAVGAANRLPDLIDGARKAMLKDFKQKLLAPKLALPPPMFNRPKGNNLRG